MSDYNLGTARGKIVLDADTSGATEADQALGRVGQSADDASKKLENAAQRNAAVSQTLQQAGRGFLIVGSAIVAGFGVAVKTAADFEFQMSAIQAVSGATADEMDLISEAALRIGKDTVFSASEAGLAMEELVKAGISVTDVLNGAADATVALAAAGGVDLPTAATIAANAMNQFNIAAEDLVGVTDTIAGAANASAIDMHQFAMSLSQVGAVANLSGASFEDTATAIALLGNAGIVGSDAGTSLKQVFLNLIPTTKKQTDLMKELGLMTEDGANAFYDAAGNLKSMADVSQTLQDALAGMSEEQKNATLQILFGSDAIRGAAILAEGGAAAFNEMAESMGKVSAADVAATRLDNFYGSIEQLKGSAETLAIRVGQTLLPVLGKIVDFARLVVDGLSQIPGPILAMLAGAGALTGVILVLLGTAGLLAGSLLQLRSALLLATGASTLFGNAGAIAAVKTKLFAAAQALLNNALLANPIVRILALLAGLAALFITLYNNSETFRNAMQPALEALQQIGVALAPVFAQLATVFQSLFGAFQGVGATGTASLTTAFGQLAGVLGGALATAITAVAPLIIQLVTTLLTGLMPVLTAIGPLLNTIANIIATALGGNIAALPPLMAQLGENIAGVVSAIATSLLPAIISIATTIIEALVSALPDMIKGAITLFTGILDGLVKVLPKVLTAILGLLPTVIQALVSALPVLLQAAITLFTSLVTAITTALPLVIQAIVTALPLIISAAITLFTGLIDGLLTALPLIIEAIVTAIPLLIEAIVGALPQVIQGAIDLFLGIILGLVEALPSIIEAIVDAIPKLIEAITGALPKIIQGAITLFLGIITGLVKALPQIIEALVKAIPEIVQALIDAVPLFLDAGVQLMEGLLEGLWQMAGAIGDALWKIVSDAWNGVLEFFGIHSPSRLARDAMVQVGLGMVAGLKDSIRPVAAAMGDLTDAAAAAMSLPTGDDLLVRGLLNGALAETGGVPGASGGLGDSIPPSMTGSVYGDSGDTSKTVNWNYYAAPGSGQLDGEDEFKRAVKVSKVVVPGWAD